MRKPSRTIMAQIALLLVALFAFEGCAAERVNIQEQQVQSSFGIGTFVFKWPGDDCWGVYWDGTRVAYHRGANQQALQAGTYTVGPVTCGLQKLIAGTFKPFTITIQDGGKRTSFAIRHSLTCMSNKVGNVRDPLRIIVSRASHSPPTSIS
jgi:hypothetical protein